MNLLTLLRQHALTQAEALAMPAAGRIISYRRFWSRIERASARLQGEWAIAPGDTLAYWGCGHPDALLLYFALARCGAGLLPLEHLAARRGGAAALRALGVKMVLHDDALHFHADSQDMPCRPLSTLVATRCLYQPALQEDLSRRSLTTITYEPDGTYGVRSRSLADLTARALALPCGSHRIDGALFDEAVFAPAVLATLIAGKTLMFP